MIGDLPGRFRFVNSWPIEDGRWLMDFESDVDGFSVDNPIWEGSGVRNAVFRFVTADRQFVASLRVGDKFDLNLSPVAS